MKVVAPVCLLLNLLLIVPVHGEPVTVEFSATVATVTGTPFGIDPVLGTSVTGSFVYDTATADVNGNADRGDYPHSGTGAFTAVVQGYATVITGSTGPWAQVENLDPDTFRFIDGPRTGDPQGMNMSVNGTPDAGIELSIAVTDATGAAFADDGLPETFPFDFPGFPHTFSVKDDQGTMLLQFNSVVTPTEDFTWGSLKGTYAGP